MASNRTTFKLKDLPCFVVKGSEHLNHASREGGRPAPAIGLCERRWAFTRPSHERVCSPRLWRATNPLMGGPCMENSGFVWKRTATRVNPFMIPPCISSYPRDYCIGGSSTSFCQHLQLLLAETLCQAYAAWLKPFVTTSRPYPLTKPENPQKDAHNKALRSKCDTCQTPRQVGLQAPVMLPRYGRHHDSLAWTMAKSSNDIGNAP
ncbi:hypothetical protein GQ44DRAFT_733561 [Phaeosphaeriaceae sp. PMI808]|nr:hypothetical protein GQ44DRAFT_733561 [Phaeosphaeriaceae sp. PMI808]